MIKFFLMILMSLLSLAAQLNLKLTAPLLPTSFSQVFNGGLGSLAILVLRAGLFSGLSLGATWVCYRKFGFLELIVAQSSFYLFAFLSSYYFFDEPLLINRIVGVFVILCGVILFNIK